MWVTLPCVCVYAAVSSITITIHWKMSVMRYLSSVCPCWKLVVSLTLSTNSDDSLHAGQITEIFSLNGIQDLATKPIHIIEI